jgi:hypothetical protein
MYTIWCWCRAGDITPLLLSPLIYIGRLTYAIGMVDGKLSSAIAELKPRIERLSKNIIL